MAGLSELFKFGSTSVSDELPSIFPLSIEENAFVKVDVMSIYSKIITDTIERTQGLSEDELALLSDNCLASERAEGVVTLLAEAMFDKADLFLVYDRATKVVRKATSAETAQIKADYQKQASSNAGVYVSFKKYSRTDMVKIYSALEYCAVASMNKGMNLAKAVQIKIDQLRASVGLTDSAKAKQQAQSIATALSEGRPVLLDAKDILELLKPDLSSAKDGMDLFNQKRSFYLGMPASYITGELNSGLGDTGQADAKAVERGLRGYFFAIVKPVCKALFGKDLTFKSDDFNMLSTGLEVLKTFELTSAEYLNDENKLRIVNKVFGLPEDTKGGPAIEPETKDVTPPPRAIPPRE